MLKNKKCSSAAKFEIALKAIKNETTLNEICKKYEVSPRACLHFMISYSLKCRRTAACPRDLVAFWMARASRATTGLWAKCKHAIVKCAWMIDMTYLRMRGGFMYLVALIDVHSRYIVSAQ